MRQPANFRREISQPAKIFVGCYEISQPAKFAGCEFSQKAYGRPPPPHKTKVHSKFRLKKIYPKKKKINFQKSYI